MRAFTSILMPPSSRRNGDERRREVRYAGLISLVLDARGISPGRDARIREVRDHPARWHERWQPAMIVVPFRRFAPFRLTN